MKRQTDRWADSGIEGQTKSEKELERERERERVRVKIASFG